MKNQVRAEPPHLYPNHHPHTQKEEVISRVKLILSQRPEQLLFSDSMHLHSPPTKIMLTSQIIYLLLEHKLKLAYLGGKVIKLKSLNIQLPLN